MATNYAKASYTEIIDLQTVRNKCSIIGIHTPTGHAPYKKLRGFFTAFRKYRYKGVSSVRMVPAANLPVDPLGLTGIVGTTDLMDPRDNLNPILFHGAHGESLDVVIDRFFGNHATTVSNMDQFNPTSGYISSSADCLEDDMAYTAIEQRYYARLTDPTWRKFGIQSGVSLKRLVPLTWKLAQSIPMLPSAINPYVGVLTDDAVGNSTANIDPSVQTPLSSVKKTTVTAGVPDVMDFGEDGAYSAIRTFPQMFTNGVSRLGWLPTTTYGFGTGGSEPYPVLTELPKLFMGILVLPPAYNVEQYFRLAITHVFEFKEFTTSLGPMDDLLHPNNYRDDATHSNTAGAVSYFNWIQYTDDGAKKVVSSDPIDMGTTLDVINGSSEVVSDGVL